MLQSICSFIRRYGAYTHMPIYTDYSFSGHMRQIAWQALYVRTYLGRARSRSQFYEDVSIFPTPEICSLSSFKGVNVPPFLQLVGRYSFASPSRNHPEVGLCLCWYDADGYLSPLFLLLVSCFMLLQTWYI